MSANKLFNIMKKTYTFVGDKVIIQTERQLSMLAKSQRGNFLAEDEEGNLYSNNEQGMAEDFLFENPIVDPFTWVVTQDLLQRMTKGVRKI